MKKPIIGLTPTENTGKIAMRANYLHPVWKAGGIPVVLPLSADAERIRAYCENVDGLIFTGGVDVDPARYGEKIACTSVEVQPERDSFELALFRAFIRTGKPIFGICRGIQLINVALGGSLYQHLDGHVQTLPGVELPQQVTVETGSRLAGLVGTTLSTNTFHHQAVKVPAPGVRIVAHAADGVPEALEWNDYPFLLAVQWHPEISEAADANSRKLFDALICAASVNL